MVLGADRHVRRHSNSNDCLPTSSLQGSGRKDRKEKARPGAGMVLVPSGMDADGKAALASHARAVGARVAPKNKW